MSTNIKESYFSGLPFTIPDIPQKYVETAGKMKNFFLKGEVKDFFKFWTRLNDFLSLSKLGHYAPVLTKWVPWFRQWDYIDVFFRRVPKMIRTWDKVEIEKLTMRSALNLGAEWINTTGGVMKLAGRFTQSGSYLRMLGLPVTALTAGVYGIKNSIDAYDTSVKLEEFKARMPRFENLTGVQEDTSLQLQFQQLQLAPLEEAVSRLNNQKWQKVSEAVNSLASATFLTYASLFGVTAVSAGSLLALMVLGYASAWAINRCIPFPATAEAIKL